MVDEINGQAQPLSSEKSDAQSAEQTPVIKKPGALAPGAAPGKLISDAAKRALNEAAARRVTQQANLSDRPDETAGPKGAEPTRFGDWERGGIAYDF